MKTELIAPCGMNCGICLSYFGYLMNGKKRKMRCTGCNSSTKSCSHIKKYCKKLTKKETRYCYQCNDFPCKQLRALDNRYRERFHMSMIDNLISIRDNGMKKFLQQQEERYKCLKCGGVICVHNSKCYSCNSIT